MFQKAVKHESKLRLAIAGPSGSGKTYTALAIGTALAGNGRVAVVDTEHGSASKYADLFDFDVVNMDAPYHPHRYGEAIQAAAKAGYSVIVLDSMSHAWFATGGVLDIVDEAAKRSKSGNTYMAWKEGTPAQNDLIESIVGAPIHVIGTMRSKTEYALIANSNGKQEPKKLGMAPIQRDGFEYEFDVMFDMDIENTAVVTKSRCPELSGRAFKRPGQDIADILSNWLSGTPEPTIEEAATMTQWAAAAFRMPEVKNAFESAKRVADWYGFAVGDFDKFHNGKAVTALRAYAQAVNDGASAREAAENSRKAFIASKAEPTQQAAFDSLPSASGAFDSG